VIAMTGLSGTGKSSVATRLARALGLRYYSSDVVRKELVGVEGTATAAWGEGIYTTSLTEATYARLGKLAATALDAGVGVVLDATYRDGAQRQALADIAARFGAPLLFIEVTCDEEVVAERLAERVRRSDSVSDATIETYRRQRQQWEESPPLVPEGGIAVRVDTSGDFLPDLDEVYAALQGAGLIQSQFDAAS
jgi:predicted kinase